MNLALVVAVVAVMSTTQMKCGHKHFNIKNKWRPTLFPPPSSFASKRKGHFCGKAKPKTKSQNRFLITRRPFFLGWHKKHNSLCCDWLQAIYVFKVFLVAEPDVFAASCSPSFAFALWCFSFFYHSFKCQDRNINEIKCHWLWQLGWLVCWETRRCTVLRTG